MWSTACAINAAAGALSATVAIRHIKPARNLRRIVTARGIVSHYRVGKASGQKGRPGVPQAVNRLFVSLPYPRSCGRGLGGRPKRCLGYGSRKLL